MSIVETDVIDKYMLGLSEILWSGFDVLDAFGTTLSDELISIKVQELHFRHIYIAAVVLSAFCDKLVKKLSLPKNSLKLKLVAVKLPNDERSSIVFNIFCTFNSYNYMVELNTSVDVLTAEPTGAFSTETEEKLVDYMLKRYSWNSTLSSDSVPAVFYYYPTLKDLYDEAVDKLGKKLY